jgi:hypothetical protein
MQTEEIYKAQQEMNKAELHTGIDLTEWEVSNPLDADQYYNCDAVIEAYVKGEKDGLKNEQKVIFNQFQANVEKSKEITAKFLDEIKRSGFEAQSAYLKFDSFDLFQCLVLINEEFFVKDEFLKLYDISLELENSSQSDVFNISFSFLPLTNGEFDESVLGHDGFIYRIRKNS